MVKSPLFKDFSEYWYYARFLTDEHKRVIFNSLPLEQQKNLTTSYERGKWDEVFRRNVINEILDDIKEKYKYDLIDIRTKILKGKSVYLPAKFWKIITEELGQFDPKYTQYVLGGIRAERCAVNNDVVLISLEK
jgi:hypothetical protein